MNRNQLRYFVSAAEHRSFTKAAEQYYISQTAVTQQIQQLEQTLGCELFDRSTRPVSLTSAGKSFLLDAKAILERMSRAQERVHDAATGLTGTLRVGYVRGYERSDLSVLMRHFHQKNGNVLISFYRCSTDVLAAGLLHQEYDIVFTWDSTNLRTQEGVTFQTVEKARLVVALYAGHPLAQRRQLTRQELRGENILYMSPDAAPDSYGDAFFMQRYAEAGYKPNILFRSADTESILMMVAAEEGISLLPDYCTDRLYNADNLVFVPLVGEGEEEEIIAAAKQAHAHSFIMRLPQGYDTVIGESGGSLSQGQKQLLCIARVMLCLPPMLILDEATSSIDTRTEIKIQNAFAKMMEGRTSFIVAHRLSTIQSADVILVMKDGNIIEQGNHETLLAKGGFYANLYNSQFAV